VAVGGRGGFREMELWKAERGGEMKKKVKRERKKGEGSKT